MRKTKLLIVSYLFPPAGGVAVQRVLSFVRYLPREYYEIHVLTARNAAAPTMDESLLQLVPEYVRVHSLFTPEIPFRMRQGVRNWISPPRPPHETAAKDGKPAASRGLLRALIGTLACPDTEVVWVPGAILKARRLITRYKIDVVLVTAPPFSAFLIGNHLKRRYPRLKLISDFRDEWLDFSYRTFAVYKSPSTFRRVKNIERETVALADAVLTVTESHRRTIAGRYPGLKEEKLVHLANGYDPEMFANFHPRPHDGDKLIIAHLGTVYQISTPARLLDALDGLPEAIRERVELRFAGRITEPQRPLLEGRKVAIRCLGFLPQSEAFRQAEVADFLFLSITDPNLASGKIYEYLAMGKPILALSPPGGEVDRVLRETGAGWCADPRDATAVREMLLRAFQNEEPPTAAKNAEAIRQYERPRLAARLDRLIRGTLLRSTSADE